MKEYKPFEKLKRLFYGLQHAFKLVGAKNIIISLWQVPDKQTQELMVLFYEKWLKEKISIRKAFQVAQQKIKSKYSNPYFWAGFVLIE